MYKKYSLFMLVLCLIAFPLRALAGTESSGFDYPAGKPDGAGYTRGEKPGGWDGWGFLEDNGTSLHPGEDWNRGGGETDFGDPLYAISEGIIVASKNYGGAWGKIVLIEHTLVDGSKAWSQYAHLSEIGVTESKNVSRGEYIGKIGNAEGKWASHLHFEIRKVFIKADGWLSGYDRNAALSKYYNPTDFINSHRPVAGQKLTASLNAPGQVDLSWTKSESNQFARYELYRSTAPGGTEDPSSRTQITKTEDQNTLTHTDTNVSGGNTYYYRLFTYFKSGLWAKSDEVAVELKRVITPITNVKGSAQRFPVIDSGIIYWEDLRSENNTWPQKLYGYDIAAAKQFAVQVGNIINGLQRPLVPQASGNRVVFEAHDRLYSGTNIYMYDGNTDSTVPITTRSGEQMTPSISSDGITVWSDLRNGKDLDLYYLDTRNAQGEISFVIQSGNQRSPKIWGNKVVWKDSRALNRHDLYLKEIGSDTETLLAQNAGDGAPDIWENYVVWEYKGKISLVDLNTKQTKTITEKFGGTPKVRDGKVVYTLSEDGSTSYIHVYDIATGKDTKIDYPIFYGSSPFISGNWLVFDHSEKMTVPDMEIYLTQL